MDSCFFPSLNPFNNLLQQLMNAMEGEVFRDLTEKVAWDFPIPTIMTITYEIVK